MWLLLPVLWTTKGKRRRLRGFGVGYLSGLAFWAINLKWIATVSWVGVVAVSGYLSIYFGCFGAFAAVAGNPWRKKTEVATTLPLRLAEMWRSLGYAAVLGGMWCGLEWIRGWFLTGFGWNGLGVAFNQSLVLAQNAEFIGVIGLSFLPVFFSAILVQVGRRFYLQNVKGGVKLLHWDFATGLIVIMVALTLGALRLNLARNEDVIEAKVALMQQDIPQIASQQSWEEQRILHGFIELTEKTIAEADLRTEAKIKRAGNTSEEMLTSVEHPDLVVWPETSIPYWFFVEEGSPLRTQELVERDLGFLRGLGNFTFLAGHMEVEAENGEWKEGGRAWNSLTAMTPQNERTTYRKQHRVIFGEYIPEIDFLRKLYEHSAGVEYNSNIAAGEGDEGLELNIRGKKVEAIPSICFEDTVPRLARKFIRDGAQVIVNVTNDGWFHESEGAAQHFANSRFRCIELRRPMIRSANRGSTAVVSVTGSTVDPFTGQRRELLDENGRHFTRGTLSASVWIPRNGIRTLYSMYGDWFSVSGLVLALLWGIVVRFQIRSEAEAK